MSIPTMSLAAARSRLRTLGLSIAGLLVCAVLLGSMFAGEAQAATTYSTQETAFINALNQYRATKGLQPLLLSDAISEACYRHNHDMAKYKFFDHFSLKSDWFATNASPWTRMAASGYAYETNKAENIAAGQSTAALVLAAWKASSDHNANMLNADYKVIGVSFHQLAGSPYTYYWTTDFGGYVDPTAHAVGASPSPSTSGAARYEQTDGHLSYSGSWSKFSKTVASGGSYGRALSSGASVTATFNGTYLSWIATAGTTLGKAYVSLDGGPAVSVDLARSTVAYQQKVWETGMLSSGTHTVRIWRDSNNPSSKYISVDAFDVIGTLGSPSPSPLSSGAARYEQTDGHLSYSGSWSKFSKTVASGGSYGRALSSGASVTATFNGTYLSWIATAGTTLGKAYVSLDGGPAVSVDLARSTVAYQQKVWETGMLSSGTHTVRIWRDSNNPSSKYISVDAFDVIGTLN